MNKAYINTKIVYSNEFESIAEYIKYVYECTSHFGYKELITEDMKSPDGILTFTILYKVVQE